MFSKQEIPSVSVEQMREIDAYAEKHFGLETGFMMETAGRSVASFARDKMKIGGLRVVVLAGKGHNGGDGLVAARFLRNWGADVNVIVAEHPDSMAKLTKWHYGILKSMHVPVMTPVDFMKFENYIGRAELAIDALLGYNISGDPRDNYATLISSANSSKAKVLAVDVPSGLDADTGKPYDPCIVADWTVALTLPKKGSAAVAAKKYAGDLYVADIGVPHEVYELMGLEIPRLFKKESVLKFR